MSSKMSVDALSDSELRSKLLEYGYSVGPVTKTTRKILVKKLKTIIENRSGAGSRHSLAARYSSDETDDDAVTDKKKKSTSARRQTLANPMPPPSSVSTTSIITRGSRSPTKKKVSRNLETTDIPRPDFVAPERITAKSENKKYVKNYTSSVNDGLETGSDSDVVDDMMKYPKTAKSGSDSTKPYEYKTQDRNSVDTDYSSKPYETQKRSIHTIRDDKYTVPPFSTNISPIQPVKDDAHRNDGINDILSNYDTPFLSEFTRRLSAQTSVNLSSLSKPSVKSSILRHTSNLPEVKESDSNGHFTSLRTTYPSSSRYVSTSLDRNRDVVSRAYKSSTKNNKEDVKNNQNMISMVLLAVLALFFGVLAIVYLGLGGKTDNFPSLPADSLVPLCNTKEIIKSQPGVNCVLTESVDNAFQLLRKLHPILLQRAVATACDNAEEPSYLSDTDVIEMFATKTLPDYTVKEDLYNAQLLIWKNPKWGISLVEIGEDTYDISEFNTLEKVFLMRLDGKVGMGILNPDLPMQCLIRRKIFTVFSVLLIAAFGLLILIGIYKLVLWYLKHKKNTEREVFQLVSEIISKVELNHQNAVTTSPGGTQESYLAINHVRDNLIPPKDRKKMASLWEKAVKFLDENESRIRREVQQVAGEEFYVWRWLPNNNLNMSNSHGTGSTKKSKVWQGQAFETIEGSVNSLTCSPTPCLKIRHMFDPDEEFDDDWEIKIQDAILDKCGESVKILHIKVDRGSREGCVYMKCMSQEDAGKAYRALHGCWFDGHLVTVKYLRLERYYERFPEAKNFVTPLKPSNNQRLSMQAHYWQSPLETN